MLLHKQNLGGHLEVEFQQDMNLADYKSSFKFYNMFNYSIKNNNYDKMNLVKNDK
jgi:hypothetical protein